MKTHSLALFLVAAVCALLSGCVSMPKDQVRASSSAVFNSDDLRVWRLTVETQKTEKFRVRGAHFELWGQTAPAEAGSRNRCLADVWVVGSQIIYAEHNYIKMIGQACGGTVTYTREVAKDDKLNSVVHVSLPEAPVIHQLNRPLVIGTWWDENIWLTVGPAVYERKAEPDGPANRSQPIHSETKQTSPVTGSSR